MKKILFLMVTVVALIMTSCGGKYNLSYERGSIDVPQAEWSDSVVINGSNGSLSIEHAPEWIEVETVDSIICYSAPLNNTNAERSDSIVVKCGQSRLAIPIRQTAKASYLQLPGLNHVEFEKTGGTQQVDVASDGVVEVRHEIKNLEATYKNGKLTLTAAPNNGVAIYGTVILTAGPYVENVKVSIAGDVCPTCNGTGKVRCRKCGGAGIIFDPYSRDSCGCKACGGSGYRSKFGLGDLRKGSGKQTCPTCHGAGK